LWVFGVYVGPNKMDRSGPFCKLVEVEVAAKTKSKRVH
jgi:hypothetical protein